MEERGDDKEKKFFTDHTADSIWRHFISLKMCKCSQIPHPCIAFFKKNVNVT